MENKQPNSLNCQYRRIAIKVGSNVLTQEDGTLDTIAIASLVDQIATLRKQGTEVILITSGAVAAGRSHLTVSKKLDPISARQLFSTVGQTLLMSLYYQLFAHYNLICGQVLTTKEGFRSRQHYLNQKNCIDVMIEQGVLPIINENDAISITELMFTDNDELSALVASMMDVDALIILTNVDGVFTGAPSDPASVLIERIDENTEDLTQYIQSAKSIFGRGGMITKCNAATKLAKEGINVYIANGNRDNVLINLMDHKRSIAATHFVAANKTVTGIKKWVAHSDGFSKGELHISQGAYEALCSNRVVSLLPIGLTKIVGEFEKRDIVKIVYQGKTIGVGRTNCNHFNALKWLGEKAGQPLIHYDYLYIGDF